MAATMQNSTDSDRPKAAADEVRFQVAIPERESNHMSKTWSVAGPTVSGSAYRPPWRFKKKLAVSIKRTMRSAVSFVNWAWASMHSNSDWTWGEKYMILLLVTCRYVPINPSVFAAHDRSRVIERCARSSSIHIKHGDASGSELTL
jgi:hypothetical protein